MKTSTNVSLNWVKSSYGFRAKIGKFDALVTGKGYTIVEYCGHDFTQIFAAKARSNKDAFQRATNKLFKLALAS